VIFGFGTTQGMWCEYLTLVPSMMAGMQPPLENTGGETINSLPFHLHFLSLCMLVYINSFEKNGITLFIPFQTYIEYILCAYAHFLA
jgi:hypothetical protein